MQLDHRAIFAAHSTRHKGPQSGALCEEYTDEERLMVAAVDAYKRANQRAFPAITEVLAVIRAVDRHIGEVGVDTPARRLPAPSTRESRAIARGLRPVKRPSPPAGDDGDEHVVAVRRS